VQDTLLFPLRVAISPSLLRTYLRTLLLLIASAVLFAFAAIAYTSFYYSYIPIRGLSVPVYLQFDHGAAPGILVPNSERRFGQESQKWPHGIAGLHGLVTRQKYDVRVEIRVPRSRANLDAGNWMLDLALRAPVPSGSGIKNMLGWDDESAESSSAAGNGNGKTSQSQSKTLAHSRRPAILTYRSWPTEHLHRLLRLPLYLTGFGTESETLSVSMLEGVDFRSSAPTSLRLELRSRAPLEVYAVHVDIVARLEGLRWVMYTYRLASACVFVALFWATEMGVLLLTWGAISLVFGSPKVTTTSQTAEDEQESIGRRAHGKTSKIKDEIDARSDTDHTFPTLSSQPPLRYSSPETKVKQEAERSLEDIPLAEDAEADDEDDDFVLESPLPRTLEPQAPFTDSGLGTGMDSERDRERERVRRRASARSKHVKDEGQR
jgi:seipin